MNFYTLVSFLAVCFYVIFPSRNCGCKSISKNLCLGILLDAQTVWERMSHSYMHTCSWRGSSCSLCYHKPYRAQLLCERNLGKKMTGHSFMTLKKVKFRHFTWWNQWRKKFVLPHYQHNGHHCLWQQKSKAKKVAISVEFTLFIPRRMFDILSREWGGNVDCWKMWSSSHLLR